MMKFKIEPTRRQKPLKVVVYGPEGIGKTTFASQFPDPVFIDTDNDGTSFIDAEKLPKPTDWEMLLEEVQDVAENHPRKTLVIDTADWAEILAKHYLMKKNHWKAIDSASYGAKYVALADEISKLLTALNDVIAAGVNVVITAHATLKKQELPDEIGAFDRWELKLERRDSALLKEWADLLLFVNYKTTVVTDSNNRAKAQGGERVMYTTHRPTWDAKNRLNLPDELPFKYASISDAVNQATGANNQAIPFAVYSKMQANHLSETQVLDLLIKAQLIAAGTQIAQVPPEIWNHLANNWDSAMTFYNKQNNQ